MANSSAAVFAMPETSNTCSPLPTISMRSFACEPPPTSPVSAAPAPPDAGVAVAGIVLARQPVIAKNASATRNQRESKIEGIRQFSLMFANVGWTSGPSSYQRRTWKSILRSLVAMRFGGRTGSPSSARLGQLDGLQVQLPGVVAHEQ